MKLIDNLYHYIWSGQDNNCNSYLFANVLENGGHLLIDPGHIKTPHRGEAALERLLRSIQDDGLDPTLIGLILLTHCHPDHCESAFALRRELGALVAIHESEAAYIKSMGGEVDLYLKEGDLRLGFEESLDLRIFHSPGHSPGHVTIYYPGKKVLIAGDLVFYRSTGRTDLPGGSPEQMKESIEQLSKLDVEYLLCGHPYGHPGVIKGKEEIKANFAVVGSMF
ncbi:MBL fold metallo-hydrolase [bacterium]|nr:MBL fold metallo-hydrolase [bacterium]